MLGGWRRFAKADAVGGIVAVTPGLGGGTKRVVDRVA